MSDFRDFYNWLVGGYYADGHHKCSCFTRGYSLNLDTRRGRFTLWLLHLDHALRDAPNRLRWWAADQVARAALRMRGGRTYVFGFYDSTRGNRAAKLADDIRTTLFLKLETADFVEAAEVLDELAAIKGAVECRHEPPRDGQLELMPDVIPPEILARAHEVADWMTANGYGVGWQLGPVRDRREDPL